jgi:hypothetical protein
MLLLLVVQPTLSTASIAIAGGPSLLLSSVLLSHKKIVNKSEQQSTLVLRLEINI